MEIQLRDYRIQPGHMDDWIAGWKAGVVPLRQQEGFQIVGAWVDGRMIGSCGWLTIPARTASKRQRRGNTPCLNDYRNTPTLPISLRLQPWTWSTGFYEITNLATCMRAWATAPLEHQPFGVGLLALGDFDLDQIKGRMSSLNPLEKRAQPLAAALSLEARRLDWCVALAGMTASELASEPDGPADSIRAALEMAEQAPA